MKNDKISAEIEKLYRKIGQGIREMKDNLGRELYKEAVKNQKNQPGQVIIAEDFKVEHSPVVKILDNYLEKLEKLNTEERSIFPEVLRQLAAPVIKVNAHHERSIPPK